jgi:Hint domain
MGAIHENHVQAVPSTSTRSKIGNHDAVGIVSCREYDTAYRASIRTSWFLASRYQLMKLEANMHTRFIIGMTCTLALGACRPDSSQISTRVSSASEIAGNVGKAVPAGTSNQPFNSKSPLTATEISSGTSPSELKYRVLDLFPNPFFCDPDEYPVARADEAELARQHLTELQASPEEFQAILKHKGLSGSRTFTDEQTLLIYREHKKLGAIHFEPAGDSYRFQLQISEGEKQGFLVKGLVDSRGSVTVQEREPSLADCPVCLAPQTQIDTPKGPVPVADLRAGDAVWTADESGARLAATIVKTVRVPVPANHKMVHVVLENGRELLVSPGHRTVDEHSIGNLKKGDLLGGGHIIRIEEEAYNQAATYDLLPSGPTGNYWANGILIGSTLAEIRQ